MRFRPFAARSLTAFALVPALAAITGAGCGQAAHPHLVGDDTRDDPAGMASGGNGFDFDSGPPPGCGVGPDGGVCACIDLPLLSDPPNLYFVLDRSGSMNDNNKWQTVRTVLATLVGELGPRANFGVTLFPNPRSADACSAGAEVFSVRSGTGDAALAMLTATNVIAAGGTPTAATLAALPSQLSKLSGKTFVVLATDGGPNCNLSASCSINQCIPNIESSGSCLPTAGPNCCDPSLGGGASCLDAQASVDAVTSLAAASIPTYVVGVPGSAPYASVLEQLAKSGGTARPTLPSYYRVDTADAAAFRVALSQVAAKIIASCTLPFGSTPPDPGLVNVYLDQVVVPQDPVNGWILNGSTVTLLGTTCDRVLAGNVLDVRVIQGCPTVEK